MSAPVLVCFAVPQEAKALRKILRGRNDVRILVTGMGARNTERALCEALRGEKPARVFTCGFAGALKPDLRIGDVVFDSSDPAMTQKLSAAGARLVRFACEDRVAVTVAEKKAVQWRTKADAVEMESAHIQRLCREAGVPCHVVRAISDIADEDLPLDFNRLLGPDENVSATKLALAIVKAPQRIPALMRLGRNSALASDRLASVLVKIL